MSKIVEVQHGEYHYIDWNGFESEVEFAYLRGKADDNYNCIKVNGKYGIIKDYKYVIADAVYSNIRCNWNMQNEIINYFEYRIDVTDESGKEYKVYGKILVDGTVIQDSKLHYPHDYDKKYLLRIPSRFIFICHFFGKFYLFHDKYDYYGMLQFDENLQPYIIGSLESSFSRKCYFKSFIYRDKYQPSICFYKEIKNDNNINDNRECIWFLGSKITGESRYIKGYDRIQSIWPVENYFWWFKQDGYYGLIDPFLKVILPPVYVVDRENFSNIDFIIASKSNGKWGVLEIREAVKTPFWKHDTSFNTNGFYKTYEYEVYIPFEFKNIYRSGNYITIENFKGKQCIYSLDTNCNITSSVFSSNWKVLPQTIGENLVGAFLKGHNMWKPSEEPNLKYVFLDVNTGETIIQLPPNIFIKTGFKGGKATVGNTDGITYKVDKNGYLYKQKNPKISLCELEEEEYYEDPFINHYSEEEADNFYGMTDGMEGDLW